MDDSSKLELLQLAAHVAEHIPAHDKKTLPELGLPPNASHLAVIEALYARFLTTLSA